MSSRVRLELHHLGRYDAPILKLAQQVAERSQSKIELSKVIAYCKPHIETDAELASIHSTALKALGAIGGNIGWPESHLPRKWKEKALE